MDPSTTEDGNHSVLYGQRHVLRVSLFCVQSPRVWLRELLLRDVVLRPWHVVLCACIGSLHLHFPHRTQLLLVRQDHHPCPQELSSISGWFIFFHFLFPYFIFFFIIFKEEEEEEEEEE